MLIATDSQDIALKYSHNFHDLRYVTGHVSHVTFGEIHEPLPHIIDSSTRLPICILENMSAKLWIKVVIPDKINAKDCSLSHYGLE